MMDVKQSFQVCFQIVLRFRFAEKCSSWQYNAPRWGSVHFFFFKTDHSKQFTVMFEVHVQNQSVSVLTSEYFKGSAKKNATSSGHICYG